MSQPLLPKKLVDTPRGRVAYLEAGAAGRPVVLLVHGIPTSSYLWRHVMRCLEADFHVLAPDLMGLGDTLVDPARTDFTMPSQAEMLEQFLDALGVERAHVVAHDQGGAAVQILAARHAARIDRLVLTDCVCYDNWPVPAIAQLMALARVRPVAELATRLGVMEWRETRTRRSAFRRGVVDRAALTDETIREYLRPTRGSREARERFFRFLLAGSPRFTMSVVPALRQLQVPTLILWAAEDVYIPSHWGRRLYEDIPGARRFVIVPGAGHFWPEEKAPEFAAEIGTFLAEVPPATKAEGPVVSTVPAERLRRRCPSPTRAARTGK